MIIFGYPLYLKCIDVTELRINVKTTLPKCHVGVISLF